MTPSDSTSYPRQRPVNGPAVHGPQPAARPLAGARVGMVAFRHAGSALAPNLREDTDQALAADNKTRAADSQDAPPEQNPLWIIVAAMACLFGVMAAVLALG
jgi:hypothetical protein